MQLCQVANIHVCPQCPCEVFSSAKALEKHNKKHHNDTRVTTNTALCTKHLQGSQTLNYTPIWPDALKFVDAHLTPDPASFRTGLHEKINDRNRDEFDNIFMSLVHAFNEGSQEYIGADTYVWNKASYSFLWLLLHVEMLILCPQKDKKSGESINECVARRMGLFRCGHISTLWDETRSVASRKPSTPRPPSPDGIDKSI